MNTQRIGGIVAAPLSNEKPAILHQPQGKMCATCVREHSGCSDLDFDMMRVINRLQNVVIVHCSAWVKKKK